MIYVDNVHPSLRKSYSSFEEDDQETGILNEFSKGVGAGVDQLQGLIGGGGKALAGSLFGNDEWFVEGMSYYEEQMNEAAQNQADVGRFEDIEGFGDILNYSAFIVGNVVPSLIGGGGAGLVGGAIAKGGLKKIANTALSTVIKPNAQKLAKQQSAKAFAATQAGREIAGKQAGIGRAVGAMAFGTAAGAGESFTRILEETGEEAPLVALATGVASGSLDALTPMRVLKRVVPAERYKDIAEKVGESVASNSSMKMRMLKEAGKTAGIEGATEMMQEIVQNATLEVVRGLGADIESSWVERMTSEDKMSQYMNAAIAGAIGGAAIGGVSGIAKNPTKIEREPASEVPTEADGPIALDGSVPATLEENLAQDRKDLQQDAADQVANRQGRGNTSPMTIEEARAKAQGLPVARETNADPAARRQEAQRVIRDQIAGMAGVRDQVKEIYRQQELGALGETTRIPAEKPAPVAVPEEVPFGGNLPDNITPPLDSLVGTDVDYAGNKGLLGKNEEGYFVSTQDNGDVFIESGEYQTLAELGVTPLSGDLEFTNDLVVDLDTKKFQLRGEEFTLTRIIKDAKGKALSLAVRDSRGKRKTIRSKEIVERIEGQFDTAPDFSQIKVELDELPVDIQQAIVEQSEPESIPDEVTAQEALDVASTLPNADQLTTALNESFQINLPKGDNNTVTPSQYNQTIRRPSALTPLSEAVKDINQSQGSNRSPIDESRIDQLFDGIYGGPIELDGGGELTPVNLLDGINENPEGMSASIREEVKAALLDLMEAGMPKSVLKDIAGIFIHSQGAFARETDGAFYPQTGALSLSRMTLVNLVMEADNNNNRAGAFRYVLAHELGHAYDVSRSLSETAPEFQLVVDGITPEGVELQVGSILNELGRNYQNGTELGLEMDYPFGDAWFMLNDNPTEVDEIIGVIQKEAFAQAFAVFHSSPELLQESAPLTYTYFKKLLQTPAESRNDGQVNTETQEVDTEIAGVRADVRPQTVSGSEQVQDGTGAGEDGRASAVAEEASEGLGEQGQPQDGDDSGQPVQPESNAANKQDEDTAEPAKGTAPTIKRAENFASEGEYAVTTSDGTVYKIYRDTTQFSSPHWHLTDEFYDQLGYDSASFVRTQGIGSNRKEAVEWVDRNHTSAMQKADTAEARLVEQELGGIDDDYDPMDDLDSFIDDGSPLFAPFSRVPEAGEQSPVLPMGKVEQSLSDLLAENPNPTAEQLGSIVGAPKKRKGKESVEDVDVRPVTLDELRGYVEDSLSKSDNLKWYDDFGNLFRGLIGDANLDEASVIFGITSAQNAAENNLAETLHIMAIARKFDPVKQRKQFEVAVKATRRPDGQNLKITGRQITAIGDLYANGDFEGGIKTTTYMQMVQDRGRNKYNPFSVQDVHMSRVFGFRKKDFDKKSGALVDAAKVSGENEYRYAQYLTSVLADEFGMTPNQMQATLWFYAKDKLTPKNKGDELKAKKKLEKLKKKAEAEGKEFDPNAPKYGDGTPESSALYAAPEIQVIKNMISDGTFDTATTIADSLADGVRPRNKPAQKTTPFSTVNEREGLMDLARARSPKLIASAVAGKGRGLAFPDDTPIETLVQYNQDIMAAIVDDGGQIPILRELGIPHEIEESAGTFTGYEPSIMIRLLGGTLETANKLAPLLGDALLQDSVITSQAVYGESGLPAFVVVKKDGADFSREDAMALAESMNPSQDPDGINFNQPMNDTLMFLDSRSMKENFEYTELQAEEFYSNLVTELGDDYSVGIITTQGDYHGSDQYREAIEEAWNREAPSGSQNIYDRTNASLYEPVRKVYNEYAEKLGIPKRKTKELGPLLSPPREEDSNISDLSARREQKGLQDFKSRLVNTVQQQVSAKNEIIKKLVSDGAFEGFEVGKRYTSKNPNQDTFGFKTEITGLSLTKVSKRDRDLNSPTVKIFGQIPESEIVVGDDGKEYTASLRTTVVNSLGDESESSAALWKVKKQFAQGNAKFMGGLRPISDDDVLFSPPSSDRLQRARDMGFDTDRVFYHGTDKEFDSFSSEMLGSTTQADSGAEAIFFASREKTARSYSRGRNANESQSRRYGGSPKVIKAFLNLQNPFIVDMKNSGFKDDKSTAILKQAKEAGHDGVIFQRYYDYNSSVQGRVDAFLRRGVLSGEDIVAVFNTNQIRSVDAQFDPAKADSSNILFSPTRSASEILTNDELIDSVRASTGGRDAMNAAKNKDIKGTYQGAKKGLAGWAQKNLSSKGLLPQTAFDSMIERDGQFGAVEIDIRQLVGHYDLAIQEAYGDDATKVAGLEEALNTPVTELPSLGLAKDVQDAVAAMRAYIDGLSMDYAEILNQDIDRLKSEGNDEATAKSEILGIIVNNMGKYANRSFRAFDDPNWNETVPDQAIIDAREYLIANGSVNVNQVVNTILKEGTAFDDMGSFIAESKLGAKDLSILKKKNNDIAPEILALLGEYKDPRINFARSATKMSRLIYNDKFLKQVMANGLDTFLFTQEDAPVNATKRIAEIGSKSMNPLNGYYTFPEVEQAFRDALDAKNLDGLYKTIVQINGAVKYGKTIIAPTTVSRNWMSASMFTIANGHFRWSKIGKSLEVTNSYRTGMGDQVAYLRRIKQLGVIYDNPYAGEMIKLLEDSNLDSLINPDGKIKGFLDGATRFYQYGDDFWKIVGFENEVQNFMELKGDSREAAEVKAAERIRDTYPTYSLIGALPRKLRQFPLLGTFVSFPAEIIRTQSNMLKYLRQDLADPDMRPAAFKRMAGMAMMSAGVYAAQAMAMSAFDVSEEEEEAIKLMAAPWAKNSNILVTGRDEKGRLEYLDLTHLDPYALYKRPLNAIMRDQPADEAILDASWEIMKPFLGWDISTATILQHINNEKASGSQIYNPADTFANNAVDVYEHYEKGMGPSFLQNARRMEKALSGDVSGSGKAYDVGDELGALVGFRKTTFDPKTALHFKAYEFNEAKRNSTSLLTSSFRDPNGVSDGNLRDAFQRASDARKQAFKDMSKLVSASVSSGISPTQAMVILRSNGVTSKDAKALITGGDSAWTMSDSTLKNSISKSDLLFGKGTSQVFSKRWAMIQKWLAEES